MYETVGGGGASGDLDGVASDVAVSPDGSHAAVRSEYEVALFSLAGPGTSMVWRKPPLGSPGPPQQATMDTLVITDDRVATVGRWTIGGSGAQVDLLDYAGNQVHHRSPGDPHDLVVTPTSNRLIVRTNLEALLYDLGTDPSVAGSLVPLDSGAGFATHSTWAAGLDSIAATDSRAVGLFRNTNVTDVEIWDVSADRMDPLASIQMPEPPLDLMITPDESRVVVAGNSYVQVIDLRVNQTTLASDVVAGVTNLYVPWCDGVTVNDDHALAFGYDHRLPGQSGWVAVVDLFDQPQSYCSGGVNSVGEVSEIFASGSASVAAGDLTLWSAELPPDKAAAVIYGDGQQSLPFGVGTACVAGSTYRFPIQRIGAGGVFSQAVDPTGPASLGGAVTPGSTWNFQLLYRDGGQTNTTDGLSVTFLP